MSIVIVGGHDRIFTNTVSHKMVKCALDEVGASTDIVRCHTSSGNALNGILEARC